MSTFVPLRDRDFRLYFTGEVLSMSGSGLHIVALGWYLLARTGSATSVGIVWALGLGSGIFMLPFAGPLADRYPRRMLTIGSDLYRLALVAVMAGLAFAGSPSIPIVWEVRARPDRPDRRRSDQAEATLDRVLACRPANGTAGEPGAFSPRRAGMRWPPPLHRRA